MWGQAGAARRAWVSSGIIPTRVGTSFVGNATASLFKDHPHACGDKNLRSVCLRKITGSSPRVWGQVRDLTKMVLDVGIIPTRVGTRISARYVCGKLRDHPHACGDKKKNRADFFQPLGSSPRVWGQVPDGLTTVLSRRIIPTRVGTRPQQ